MDPNMPPPPPRKHRFSPKKPVPRSQPLQPKRTEAEDDESDNTISERLRRRLNDHLAKEKSQPEKQPKSVIFGPTSSSTLRTFDKPKQDVGGSDSELLKDPDFGDEQDLLPSLPSTALEDVTDESSESDDNVLKKEKKYIDPWDYDSYYPTTLPLRRPNSGDPELLDKEEFGEAASKLEYDENAASDLGLLDDCDKPRMFFVQLPPNFLPSGPVDGKEKTNKPMAKGKEAAHDISNESDSKLPQGYLGKMLVYKSGAVKMKRGDMLFDVNPGVEILSPQDVVAMNTEQKHCCKVGEIGKRMTVTPDIDALLKSI